MARMPLRSRAFENVAYPLPLGIAQRAGIALLRRLLAMRGVVAIARRRRLASRGEVCGAAADQTMARAIKRSRYALLETPWNMSRGEHQKLADIQTNNERLFRARLLNDTLADALAYGPPHSRATRATP